MLKDYKKYSLQVGMIFTAAVAVFGVAFTWIVFSDDAAFKRIVEDLYDCGVDALGAFACAALYYGCMKQKSDGAIIFRILITLVSAEFLVNALMYYTKGLAGMHSLHMVFIISSKVLDLVMIYYFYQYVKETLGFKGRLASLADKLIPIMLGMEIVVILINFFYPLTFMVAANGKYHSTGLSVLEDIYLIAASAITTILIIKSDSQLSQKGAALTFIFLPLFNYATTFGEFGNASQYGMILMSLIIMYCIIFNYNSTKLAATQVELDMATGIQAGMLPSIFPAFPNREEFDLYASMDPAKEVGGDFYDFFMIDDDHLCIVIADVSGKGVPAALFI